MLLLELGFADLHVEVGLLAGDLHLDLVLLELQVGVGWSLRLLPCGRRAFLLLALHGLKLAAHVGDDFLRDLRELLEFRDLAACCRVARKELQMLHDVLVERLHDGQDLQGVCFAGLHCGKELLQFGGVHAQVHAVELVVEHGDRRARGHRLVLHHRDLRVDSQTGFRCSGCVAVNEIVTHPCSGDVADQVAPADIVEGAGDVVELPQREQTVGLRTGTDRLHGGRERGVQALDHIGTDTPFGAAVEEFLDRTVLAVARDKSPHNLAKQAAPCGVEQVQGGTAQA